MSEISISREDAITILHCIFEDIPVYAQPTDEQMIASLNKAISDMERVEVLEKENAELKQKLAKIEQIIKKYNLQDITRDDVDDIVSGFEYEIIMAILGKDIKNNDEN